MFHPIILHRAMNFSNVAKDSRRLDKVWSDLTPEESKERITSLVNYCGVLMESLQAGVLARNSKEAQVYLGGLQQAYDELLGGAPSSLEIAKSREKVAYLSRAYSTWQERALGDIQKELVLGCSELIQLVEREEVKTQELVRILGELLIDPAMGSVCANKLRGIIDGFAPTREDSSQAKEYLARKLNRANKLAQREFLPGLANLERWLLEVDGMIRGSKRGNDHAAIALVDIDGFLGYADQYGIQKAELVLEEVAGILQVCVGQDGVVARANGDEFYLIGRMRADEFAERCGLALTEIRGCGVTVSVACVPICSTMTTDESRGYLAIGIQRAKSSGGDQLYVYNSERMNAA